MLKNLSKREKMVIIIAFIVLISGLFYFRLFEPMQLERLTLMEETGSLRTQYMQMMALIKRKMPEVKQSTSELQEQYQALVRDFPNQKEISEFLLEIERMAKEQSITLEYFSPKNIRVKGDFSELPIHISFYANYPALVGFVYSLENSTKKMEVTAFDVKTFPIEEEVLLQVDLTVNIYIVKGELGV